MKLTDTQTLILNTAIQSPDGRLSWFPDNLKGGARNKVLGSLLRQGLIQIEGESHRVTDLAYKALGLPVPPALAEPIKAASRTRENTKQAQIIAMLQRPEGAPSARSLRPRAGSRIRYAGPLPEPSRRSWA